MRCKHQINNGTETSDVHVHVWQQLQPFNGLFSRTTWVSQYQKGKTNLDFTGARDSEWQWHQLSHMQVCTSLQTDSHAGTPPLCFLQAGCPSCRPTNSVKALKAIALSHILDGTMYDNKANTNTEYSHNCYAVFELFNPSIRIKILKAGILGNICICLVSWCNSVYSMLIRNT